MEVADIPGNVDRRTLEDAMTLPTIEEARSWRGLMLVATGNEPVGRIDAVYVDRTTRQPEWALVHTGLFGSSRTFVPLIDAAKLGDTVRVPHDPGVVREAPRLEPDADLSESDEARLYAHYRIDYTTAVSPSGLPATETGTAGADATAGPRLEADAGGRPRGPPPVGPRRPPVGAGRLAAPAARAARPASRPRPVGAGSPGRPPPVAGRRPRRPPAPRPPWPSAPAAAVPAPASGPRRPRAGRPGRWPASRRRPGGACNAWALTGAAEWPASRHERQSPDGDGGRT